MGVEEAEDVRVGARSRRIRCNVGGMNLWESLCEGLSGS